MAVAAHTDSYELPTENPVDWRWPMPPQSITLHDKYSGRDFNLRADEPSWTIVVQGVVTRIVFAHGAHGELQRKLLLLARRSVSPGSLRAAATWLVKEWPLVESLLLCPAETLPAAWASQVRSHEHSRILKPLLKLACTAEVGHWRAMHKSLIAGLDNLEMVDKRRRAGEIAGRTKLVSAKDQADLVKVLDEAAQSDSLTRSEVEGAVALALIYQHGVRPVQVLCLDLHHVRFFKDASGDLACVVAFHAAKQPEGGEFEMPRQVKQEWVPLIARQHALGISEGRKRLFDAESTTLLWQRVHVACKRFEVDLNCSAVALRRTGAQSLADAGHSRRSIAQFLGHSWDITARAYIEASLRQTELINSALGASKLYGELLAFTTGEFVSLADVEAADERKQIGAVVGERLVAGVGICKSGQDNCAYNPVTSCYGCSKFMPSLDTVAHQDAVAGMREQVGIYLQRGVGEESPAYRQLTRALAGAQQALAAIGALGGGVK